MAFYLVSSVIFGAGYNVFNSYLPNQCYNSSTTSLDVCDTTPSPSIWGTTDEWNNTLEKYNMSSASDMANPGAMLDPTAIVRLVGFYITFMFDIVSSTMLYHILVPFIGNSWAHTLTFTLNFIIVVVALRILSGRIRWD